MWMQFNYSPNTVLNHYHILNIPYSILVSGTFLSLILCHLDSLIHLSVFWESTNSKVSGRILLKTDDCRNMSAGKLSETKPWLNLQYERIRLPDSAFPKLRLFQTWFSMSKSCNMAKIRSLSFLNLKKFCL